MRRIATKLALVLEQLAMCFVDRTGYECEEDENNV